jgi:hypothetical protein
MLQTVTEYHSGVLDVTAASRTSTSTVRWMRYEHASAAVLGRRRWCAVVIRALGAVRMAA